MYCGVNHFSPTNNRRIASLESRGSESFNSIDNRSKQSGASNNNSFGENSTYYDDNDSDDDSETYNTLSIDDTCDDNTYDSRSHRGRGSRKNNTRRIAAAAERRNDSIDSYDDSITLRSDDWSTREGGGGGDRRSKYRKTWSRTDDYSVDDGRSTYSSGTDDDDDDDDSRSYYSSDYSYSSAEETLNSRRSRRSFRNLDANKSLKLLGSCDDNDDDESQKDRVVASRRNNSSKVKRMAFMKEEAYQRSIQQKQKQKEQPLFDTFDPFQVEGVGDEYDFNPNNFTTTETSTGTLQPEQEHQHNKDVIIPLQTQESDYCTVFPTESGSFDDDFSLMLANERNNKFNAVGKKVKSQAKSKAKSIKKLFKKGAKKGGVTFSNAKKIIDGSISTSVRSSNFDMPDYVKDAIQYRRSIILQQSQTINDQQQQLRQVNEDGNHYSYKADNKQSTTTIENNKNTEEELFANTSLMPHIKFSDKFQTFTETAENDPNKKRNPEESNSLVIYEHYGPANTVMMYFPYVDKPEVFHDDEVLVRVQASTVCTQDCVIRNNEWYEEIDLPNTPGCDLIGSIEKITNVASQRYGLKVGDIVAAFSPKLGSNSRYITLYASQLIPVQPDDIDVSSAVCLINAYVTAYQCLHRVGKKSLQYGDKILITDAQNDIGLAVVQLATLQGATIYASAKEEYHDLLRDMGATPIGPNQDAWVPIVQGQIDIFIYNSLYSTGGQLLPYSALSSLGKFIFLGRLDDLIVESVSVINESSSIDNQSKKQQQQLLPKNVFCYDIFEKAKESPDLFVRDFNLLLYLLKDGTIKPNINRKINLNDIINAHKDYENELVCGSIVCLPWKDFEKKGKKNLNKKTKILDSSILNDDIEDDGMEVIIDENSTASTYASTNSMKDKNNDKSLSFVNEEIKAITTVRNATFESQQCGNCMAMNKCDQDDEGSSNLMNMANNNSLQMETTTARTRSLDSFTTATTPVKPTIQDTTTTSHSNAELTTTYSPVVEECEDDIVNEKKKTCDDNDDEALNKNDTRVSILNILSHLSLEKDKNSVRGQLKALSNCVDDVIDDATIDEIEVELSTSYDRSKQSTRGKRRSKIRLPFSLKQLKKNKIGAFWFSKNNDNKKLITNSATTEDFSTNNNNSGTSNNSERESYEYTSTADDNTVDHLNQNFDHLAAAEASYAKSLKPSSPENDDKSFLFNWNDWGGQFEAKS